MSVVDPKNDREPSGYKEAIVGEGEQRVSFFLIEDNTRDGLTTDKSLKISYRCSYDLRSMLKRSFEGLQQRRFGAGAVHFRTEEKLESEKWRVEEMKFL